MSKKPLYKFVFSSVESAESFYDFAVKHSNSHLVNYSGNPDGKIDHTRVEVIGTGSNVFDMNLLNELKAYAHTLGGDQMPVF